jgi:hypothetical protein
VEFADGIACLGVGGSGYGAGVEDDDGGRCGIGGGGAAAVEELAFEGGAVGLCGAAAELLDVEGGHGVELAYFKNIYTEFTEDAECTEKRGSMIPLGSMRVSWTEDRITASIAYGKAVEMEVELAENSGGVGMRSRLALLAAWRAATIFS